MITIDEKQLSDCMSQWEAAAFAVLVSKIRDNAMARRVEGTAVEIQEKEEFHVALRNLESEALHSIAKNDGEMVKWITFAAKAMQPVLS